MSATVSGIKYNSVSQYLEEVNVYFLLEIKGFQLFICMRITLKLKSTENDNACMCGRMSISIVLTFFWGFLYYFSSFNMSKNVEWALVLPSSFIIHNLGLIVNSSKGSPKRPRLSLAALTLSIDNNPKQKPLCSPQSGLRASDQRHRQRDPGLEARQK